MFFYIPTQHASPMPIIMVSLCGCRMKLFSLMKTLCLPKDMKDYIQFSNTGFLPVDEQPKCELGGRFPSETSQGAQGTWREK